MASLNAAKPSEQFSNLNTILSMVKGYRSPIHKAREYMYALIQNLEKLHDEVTRVLPDENTKKTYQMTVA